jgi:hypothetical protein
MASAYLLKQAMGVGQGSARIAVNVEGEAIVWHHQLKHLFLRHGEQWH